MERYSNKRQLFRSGGRFRKAQASDLGIMGVCPTCRHFLLRHYNGDPRDTCPDPRKFVNRCFTCQPETPEELALKDEIEAAQPKHVSIMDILSKAAR